MGLGTLLKFICVMSISKACKGSLNAETKFKPYTHKQVIVRYRVAVTDDVADWYKNHYCVNLIFQYTKLFLYLLIY